MASRMQMLVLLPGLSSLFKSAAHRDNLNE